MKQAPAELLGARLREDLPPASDPARYAAQRSRLVQAAVAKRVRPARYVLAVTAAIAAVLLFVVFRGLEVNDARPDAGLAFRAGTDAETGSVGAYYTPHDGRVLPLAFSDGSRVSVQRNGGVRVTEARAKRTALLLETGSADFDIVHRDGAEWEVLAGPYRVRVTGTAFRLSWDASRRALELAMREGSVVVTGPGIENGYRVEGQDRFVTQVTAGVVPSATPSEAGAAAAPARLPVEEASAPHGEAAAPRSATEPATGVKSAAREPVSARGVNPTTASAPGARSPPALPAEPRSVPKPHASVESGRPGPSSDFEAVVTRAEQEGVPGVLARGTVSELRALADAARFTGRLELAQRTLRAVIARFPKTPDDAWASFVLGRIADQGGRSHEALAHYDRALRGGSLFGAEALGRKMLVLQRLGDTDGAKSAARSYLSQYPEGPYAPKARELAPN